MSKQRKRAFEVIALAFVEKPNDQGIVIEVETKIVVPQTMVVAINEQEAMFLAHRLVPDEYAGKPDQLEVRIRPF